MRAIAIIIIAAFMSFATAGYAVTPPNQNPPTTINNIWDWVVPPLNAGTGKDCIFVVQPSQDYRKLCTDYIATLGGNVSLPPNSVIENHFGGQNALLQKDALDDCPDTFGKFMDWIPGKGWKCQPGVPPGAIKTGVGSLPAGVVGSTFLMLGLAQQILPFALILTPKSTGNIDVTLSAMNINQTMIGGQVAFELILGTGTPPALGDPIPAGATVISAEQILTIDGGFKRFTANQIGWALGLTLGTQVWIDVALRAPIGGAAQMAAINIRAIEE